MAKYEVKRADRDSQGPVKKTYTIEGDTLVDAVQKNFSEILKVVQYYHVPFRYPITVRPEFVTVAPEGKHYKSRPDGSLVEYTPEEYEKSRGAVKLTLEWMYSGYRNKPETLHTHNVWIEALDSDLPDSSPFVITGK